jgi:hypothetical protein
MSGVDMGIMSMSMTFEEAKRKLCIVTRRPCENEVTSK